MAKLVALTVYTWIAQPIPRRRAAVRWATWGNAARVVCGLARHGSSRGGSGTGRVAASCLCTSPYLASRCGASQRPRGTADESEGANTLKEVSLAELQSSHDRCRLMIYGTHRPQHESRRRGTALGRLEIQRSREGSRPQTETRIRGTRG